MAADTAIELKNYNIASISLWPGAVLTDTIQASKNNANVKIDAYSVFSHSSFLRSSF